MGKIIYLCIMIMEFIKIRCKSNNLLIVKYIPNHQITKNIMNLDPKVTTRFFKMMVDLTLFLFMKTPIIILIPKSLLKKKWSQKRKVIGFVQLVNILTLLQDLSVKVVEPLTQQGVFKPNHLWAKIPNNLRGKETGFVLNANLWILLVEMNAKIVIYLKMQEMECAQETGIVPNVILWILRVEQIAKNVMPLKETNPKEVEIITIQVSSCKIKTEIVK